VIRDPLIEPHLDKALALLQAIRARTIEAVAPPHWTIEILAVIARARPERAAFVLGLLAALPFSETRTLSSYLRAAHLASRFNHHLFDTLYHAVALEEGATLVTADEAYFGKAKGLGAIRLLRDVPA
jgi:predicted nucleic acid-binding protein